MKRILITADTVCGGVAVPAWSVVDASDSDAHVLVSIGKARIAPEDIEDVEPRRARARKATS
jgi:hypothetical protein